MVQTMVFLIIDIMYKLNAITSKCYVRWYTKQNLLIRANIVSQLMVAGSLWIAIYSGFGLYSMGISQLSGIISF